MVFLVQFLILADSRCFGEDGKMGIERVEKGALEWRGRAIQWDFLFGFCTGRDGPGESMVFENPYSGQGHLCSLPVGCFQGKVGRYHEKKCGSP